MIFDYHRPALLKSPFLAHLCVVLLSIILFFYLYGILVNVMWRRIYDLGLFIGFHAELASRLLDIRGGASICTVACGVGGVLLGRSRRVKAAAMIISTCACLSIELLKWTA